MSEGNISNAFAAFRIKLSAEGIAPNAGDFDSLPGGYSEREPPDPISNSEVKTLSADDSVAAAMRK